MTRLLLKNVRIVSSSTQIHNRYGWLLIDGARIAQIGNAEPPEFDAEVIDGSGTSRDTPRPADLELRDHYARLALNAKPRIGLDLPRESDPIEPDEMPRIEPDCNAIAHPEARTRGKPQPQRMRTQIHRGDRFMAQRLQTAHLGGGG